MKRAALVLVALLMAGCATAPAPRADRAALPSPRITIEERPGNQWRVSYVLPAPLQTVKFGRDEEALRNRSWRIVAPEGARWVVDGNNESIAFTSPTERFTIELATDASMREKDYNIHFPFSDGSIVFYTGHLQVEDEAPTAWTFRTAADRDVRVLDQHGRGSLEWTSDIDTYVFFGGIAPVETPRMTLIADPGLPRWIEKQAHELVPRQFDYYTAKTGIELARKPLVLLSYSGDKSPGLSFKGGTLTGLVQINIDGAGWSTQSFDATLMWFRYLAHEAFHLWNGDQAGPADEAEWLSEASAEHAALLATRDAGVIDEAQRRRMLVEQTNDCIVRLGGKPLLEANPANFYTCGVALLERVGEAQMWPLYGRLLKPESKYSTSDFLAMLPPDDAAGIEQFVRRDPAVPADRFFSERLAHALDGKLSRVAVAEATLTQNTARRLVVDTVRRCACRNGLEARCKAPGRIDTINSIDPRPRPMESYTSLLTTPESTLVLDGKTETFRCSAADADPSYEMLLRLEP